MPDLTLLVLFRRLWADHFPDVAWPGELAALVHVFNKLTELRGVVDSFHEAQPAPMRTRDEIMRAHDILVHLILTRDDDTGQAFLEWLVSHAEVLCWTLLHDHNTAFAKSLADLEQRCAKSGMLLGRHETLQDPMKGATK